MYASSCGAIIAILYATIVTIWMEYSPWLKAWLVSVAGHHWTAKSLFTMGFYIVIFIVVYELKPNPSDQQIRGALKKLIAIAILGAIILTLFFTEHYMVV